MTPLVRPVNRWVCPNCKREDVTHEARPHSRFHTCLASLKVLHLGHSRVGPLVPHVGRITLFNFWVMAAVLEPVTTLCQLDVGCFQGAYNRRAIGEAAGTLHGISQQTHTVISLQRVARDLITESLTISFG